MADTMKLKFSRTPGKVPTPGMFTADDIFVWNIADGLLYGRKLGTDGTYSVVLVGKAISNDDGQPVEPGQDENFVSDVFIEKDGQFPFDVLKIVKNGETVEITTIPRPNGILWGGMVTWSGTGYVYSLNPTGWNMNGEFFAIDENLSFTLATPDATHDRFDVFALNNEGACVVITGTPAADPVIPSVNAETQRFLTSVLVTAASTEPDNDLAVVYDEGAVAEFTPSSNIVSANFAATFNPFHGTKHVDVGTIFHNRYLLFTAAESFDVGLYTNINFALSLKVVMSNQHNLYVSFFEAGSMISNEIPVALQKDMTGRYQIIALPINAFNFPGNNKQADAIRLRWSKTGSNIGHRGFLLDYLKLESGITPPVTESTVELTGDVKGTGKVGEAIQTTLNAPTAQTTLGDTDNLYVKAGSTLKTITGEKIKTSVRIPLSVATIVLRNEIPPTHRLWGVPVSVYNDGANNGRYYMAYGKNSTDISNNENWEIWQPTQDAVTVDIAGSITHDPALQLHGDNANPGNSKYYGTNETGTKGFHSIPEQDNSRWEEDGLNTIKPKDEKKIDASHVENLPAGYTSDDFDTDLASKTTDDITEGATNKYRTGDELMKSANTEYTGTGVRLASFESNGAVADKETQSVNAIEITGSIEFDPSLQLKGDNNAPGNSRYYGTNELGVKGFHALTAPDSSKWEAETETTIKPKDDKKIDASHINNIPEPIPQVQADWNEENTLLPGHILNKPTIPAEYNSMSFDADLALKTTDDLAEGAANKYLTGDELMKTANADYSGTGVRLAEFQDNGGVTQRETILLNSLIPYPHKEINSQASYTLLEEDTDKLLVFNHSDITEITIPLDLFNGLGFACMVMQKGTGHVRVLAGSITLYSANNETETRTQYSIINILKMADNIYLLGGDLA